MRLHDVVTFLSIASGIVGVLLTGLDIREATSRLKAYLAKSHVLVAGASITSTGSISATGEVKRTHEPSIEDRLRALEMQMPNIRADIKSGDEQVAMFAKRDLESSTGALQGVIRAEIESLRTFVVGDGVLSGLRLFRGPAVVLFSLLSALVAEVLTLAGN